MKHKTYAIPLLLVTLGLLALVHQSGLIRWVPQHRDAGSARIEQEATGHDADAAVQEDVR